MLKKNFLKLSWDKEGLEVNIENKSSGIILFIITVVLIIMLLKLIDNIILVVEIIRRTVKGEGGLREERLRYVFFNRLYRIPIIFIGISGLLYILFKDVALNDCMNFMCMGPFFPSGIRAYPRLKRLGGVLRSTLEEVRDTPKTSSMGGIIKTQEEGLSKSPPPLGLKERKVVEPNLRSDNNLSNINGEMRVKHFNDKFDMLNAKVDNLGKKVEILTEELGENNKRRDEEYKRREEDERDKSEIPKEWVEHLRKVAYTGLGTGIYEGFKNVESEESRRGSVATGEDVNRDSRAMESELRKLEEID